MNKLQFTLVKRGNLDHLSEGFMSEVKKLSLEIKEQSNSALNNDTSLPPPKLRAQ